MPAGRVLTFFREATARLSSGAPLVLVWLFVALAHAFHPDSFWNTRAFADSDDMIHLVRVMDWLQGQSWFDPLLHRLNPPEGAMIHFSRLAEWPLAVLVALFRATGFSWFDAAVGAAAVWPLALFAVFLVALRWAAQAVMPRDQAGLSAVTVLFAVPVLYLFAPGRVDHHGLVLVLLMLTLGSVLRMMKNETNARLALTAAFFAALALAIALESLPWIMMLAAWVGFWTALKGRAMAASAICFGGGFFVFTAFLIALTIAPARYGVMSTLAFSGLYGVLAAGVALALIVAGLASYRLSPAWRMVASLAVALFCGAVFLWLFPVMRAGPYGAMDPRFRDVLFSGVGEALPLLHKTENYAALLGAIGLPLFGLGLSLFYLLRATAEAVWRWFLFVLLLLATLVFSLAYQSRVISFACLFSLLPLSVFVEEAGRRLARLPRAKASRFIKGGVFAMFLGLLLIIPLDRSLLYPVRTASHPSCATEAVGRFLSDPARFGEKPLRIMNTLDEGGALLFYTPHEAMAAPYHMGVEGALVSIRFFTTRDPQEARTLAQNNKIDLVLLCADLPLLYRHESEETFAQQLARGAFPAWLRPVSGRIMEDIVLLEMVKP